MSEKYTARQIEALAQRLLKRPLNHLLSGERIALGTGIQGLVNRLQMLGLVSGRGQHLTTEGLDALEANLDKLPVVDATKLGFVLEVELAARIADRRASIAEELAEAEAERKQWAAAKVASENRRAAAIPARLRELLKERNLPALDAFRFPDQRQLDDVLVDLWNAIVDEDVAL